MERDEVKKLLKFISISWNGTFEFPTGDKKSDAFTVSTWNAQLQGFTTEQVMEAVHRVGLKSEYAPTPYKIVQEIVEDDFPGAHKAWSIARDYYFHKNRGQDIPKIVRETYHRLETPIGGLEDQVPYYRKNFIETYKEIKEEKLNKAAKEITGRTQLQPATDQKLDSLPDPREGDDD